MKEEGFYIMAMQVDATIMVQVSIGPRDWDLHIRF